MNKENPQVAKFFNSEQRSIDDRIRKGETKVFDKSHRAKAKAYAKTNRSYVYEVFDSNKKLIGYAVPK